MAWYYNGVSYVNPNDSTAPQEARVSVLADSEADLPTVAQVEAETGVYTPMIGSKGYAIAEAAEYMMDSTGTWVKQEDSPFKDVYTKTETDALIEALDAPSVGGTGSYIKRISETDGVITATVGTIDTVPASGSDNPISSGAVYNATLDNFIGNEITTAIDLNNLTTPGVYRSTNSTTTGNITNKPSNTYGDVSSRGAIIIVQYAGNTGYFRQTYIPGWNANHADKFFVRHYRGPYSSTDPRTGWSNWYVYEGTDTGS